MDPDLIKLWSEMVEVAPTMSTPPADEPNLEGLRNEYVQVLLEAVKYFLLQGRVPTASQARSRLGHITNGGFDPKRIGFARFRDFLDYAEAAGSITVDHSRAGDVTVSLPGIEHDSNSSSARAIRKDLWDAFLDWRHEGARYYDRINDRVESVPNEIAPLEPDDLTMLRKALEEKPDEYVAVVAVERDTQIAWMHKFAADVPDREVKAALLIALASANAAGEFKIALKSYPTELRRWYAYLTNHVEKSITAWMTANNLQIELWVENSGRVGSSGENASRPLGESRATPRQDLGSRVKIESVDELRKILHTAIDQMPVEQLRQLSIPVGYLLDL